MGTRAGRDNHILMGFGSRRVPNTFVAEKLAGYFLGRQLYCMRAKDMCMLFHIDKDMVE